MLTDKLKKEIKKLPQASGVYKFLDSKGTPIYIGKAINLHSRVSHYQKSPDSRIRAMVIESYKLDFEETKTDIEALILESRLIKKHRPKFNIVMRDDKQYFFVAFPKENFSRIYLTHQPMQIEHIGPFTEGTSIKAALKHLRRLFPYCTCKQKHNIRCLNAHIGKCLGFCCLKE